MKCYDDIYQRHYDAIPDFSFNQEVASVFDNMIERSIPGYKNLLDNISLCVQHFFKNRTQIYDMGCSTGNVLEAIIPLLKDKKVSIQGVDFSEPMIQEAKVKLNKYISDSVQINFHCSDVTQVSMTNVSVVIVNFTLQFIPPNKRDLFLEKIYESLCCGGILILSEKISFTETEIQKTMIHLHEYFKKQKGYTDLEIFQKRVSLEKILFTDTLEEIKERLQKRKFSYFVQHFQNLNFVSFLAVK